jgi:hypothetical protein
VEENQNKSLRESLVEEIEKTKDLLVRYWAGDLLMPKDFNYKSTILKLQHLRNKQKVIKKQERTDHEKEQ